MHRFLCCNHMLQLLWSIDQVSLVSEGSKIMSLLLMAISSLSNSHRSLIRQESGSIHIIFNAYRNINSIRYIKNFVIFIILNFQSYQQSILRRTARNASLLICHNVCCKLLCADLVVHCRMSWFCFSVM